MEQKFKLGMIAGDLVEKGKGILAADESPSSLEHRFSLCNIENSEKNRKIFRESIFKAIEPMSISGVILHDESFDMKTDDGVPLTEILTKKGIRVGIKLDKGLTDFNEKEKLSIGLEDLESRLRNKKYEDATFAKWRSVFHISENTPSDECISENSRVLAEYASITQKHGLVPIVEPEILWSGEYSIEKCFQVTKTVLNNVIYELNKKDVYMPGILIKTGFVTPGDSEEMDTKLIVVKTLEVLGSTIPCSVPGIVFLSGGHGSKDSFTYLSVLNRHAVRNAWRLTFSFGRALTDTFLQAWQGEADNLDLALSKFKQTLNSCGEACLGTYVVPE
ncbi:Fructose-bisphosphate aldolase [Dictyocoela roeselum]|nr:Fructose-bisphosphate aldolase [Dictyocoela roeselum]